MIEIDIKTPYAILNGRRKWPKNSLYVGRKRGDIVLPYETIMDNAFFIEVIEAEIYIHPHQDLEFFLLNGKRTTKSKKIKSGDAISFGQSQIIFISGIETPKRWTDEEREKMIQKWGLEKHPLHPLIQEIDKQYKVEI